MRQQCHLNQNIIITSTKFDIADKYNNVARGQVVVGLF